MSSSERDSSRTKELSPAVMPTVEISEQNIEIQILLTSVNDYVRLIYPVIRVYLLNLSYFSSGTETGNPRLARAGL